MEGIEQLIEQEGFLRSLFQAIPCGVLVVDEDRRVQMVNRVVERTFGVGVAEVINLRGGEIIRCIHAHDVPDGCGYSNACQSCDVRSAALAALAGNDIRRRKTRVRLVAADGVEDLTLLVSAAPVTFGGRQLAIVILEDITEVSRLRERLKQVHSFAGIVGRDETMLEVFDTIRELADVSAPVLVQGESGTGKELVAAAIHNEGARGGRLFVPVNCSALPESLLESELFGHVRGAFTGAIRDKKGRFELADGGTIFLDEVGDLSPAVQVKLLRVLQQSSFERVGGEETINVDVRIISATNRDLPAEVAAGNFREDLYYRLCVVPVSLPPLRERRNDIPLLAEHVLKQILEDSGRGDVALSPEALSLMIGYDWPGNVRELQNAIQFGLVKCRGAVLYPEHLPASVIGSRTTPLRRPVRRRRRLKLSAPAVRRALDESRGNKVQAARLLGVSRATLYRFLADHDV